MQKIVDREDWPGEWFGSVLHEPTAQHRLGVTLAIRVADENGRERVFAYPTIPGSLFTAEVDGVRATMRRFIDGLMQVIVYTREPSTWRLVSIEPLERERQ